MMKYFCKFYDGLVIVSSKESNGSLTFYKLDSITKKSKLGNEIRSLREPDFSTNSLEELLEGLIERGENEAATAFMMEWL